MRKCDQTKRKKKSMFASWESEFFYTGMRQLYTTQPDGSKMLQNHRKHFGNHAKCMDDASLCCAK